MTNLASIDPQLLTHVSGGSALTDAFCHFSGKIAAFRGGSAEDSEAQCKANMQTPLSVPELSLPHLPSLPSFSKLLS
jgi:hypothetical protein